MIDTSYIKDITEKIIFIDSNLIKEKISSFITIKPNIKIFNNIELKGSKISSFGYIYLFSNNELRIRIFDKNNLNLIKNKLIDSSSLFGGYSVKSIEQSDNQSTEISIVWPPITKEKIDKCKKNLSVLEVELFDLLRKKRNECKNIILKDKLPREEEKKIIDKYIDKCFLTEKSKISSLIKEFQSKISI